MNLHVEPPSLVVVSLQRTTKLLVDTVAKVCKQGKVRDSKKLCRFRYKKLPSAVANALAYKFLQELDRREDLVQFTNVLKKIIHIFLPSGVSELRIDWHWIYIGEILLNGETCLQRIKILKVARRTCGYVTDRHYAIHINKRLFNDRLITGLRELTLHDICTDKILAIVCKTCKSLQALDVTGSMVTDKKIESIFKLKNLEKLIITYTFICNVDLILEGLLDRKIYKLNSFGCTRLDEGILLLLAQFQNLNSLSTTCDFAGNISAKYLNDSESPDSHCNRTLTDEISLQNLQHLEIDQKRYLVYPSFFVTYFGNRLLTLKIEAAFVDITHLAKHCPLLSSLYLRTNKIEKNLHPTVSEFPSLQNLTLVMASEYSPTPLLSFCNNLIFLDLCANVSEYTEIQNEIFQTDILKNLEVLFIASNDESVPMQEVVENFELHCAKLQVQNIKVFGKNYVELTEKFRSYHGVEVSSELCLNVVDELYRTRQMIPRKLYPRILPNPSPGARYPSIVISTVPEEDDHSLPQADPRGQGRRFNGLCCRPTTL